MQDYDAIPYESTPIADAHPYKLAALGKLLGLTPPAPASARILELGCAEGGTLIPLARLWPQAQLLGLELSAVQTNNGNALIQALGLNNVRIQQADILQVGSELGQFDYIIAHGVYSWVPPAVQQKILQLCQQCLSPQGLAYISYNVNPGWRLRGALRDMFAYHLRDETSPQRKLDRALAFCDLLEQGLGTTRSTMADYLREEIAHIRKARRAYVYHEYLESVNEPILFSEFLERAKQHRLNYVCDTELYSMFPSSFGKDAEAMLEQFADVPTTEQYADFLRMRTFRQTILCHAALQPNYDIDLGLLEGFALYSNLTTTQAINVKTNRSENFHTVTGKPVSISHPLTKAILLELQRVFPNAVPLPELISHAQKHLWELKADKFAAQPQAVRGELFNLFANNLLGLSTQPHHFAAAAIPARVTDFARLQAQRPDGFISTIWSETLSLDPFSTRLIQLLDGSRSKDALTKTLYQEFVDGSLTSGNNHDTVATLHGVERNVERLLALFARNGILA